MPTTFTPTFLGTAPVTGFSEAAGLNAKGQVVGQEDTQFPFIWTPATANGKTGTSRRLSVLPLPGGPGTGSASAINDNGDVVGACETFDPSGAQVKRAVLWKQGTGPALDIGTLIPNIFPPGTFLGSSEALGINNAGVIVGVSDSATGVRHAFVFDPALGIVRDLFAMVPLAMLPGTPDPSMAKGINNLGDIVGEAAAVASNGAVVTRAFFLPAGSPTMNDLGTLLAVAGTPGASSAVAINDARMIVGSSDFGNPGQIVPTPAIFSPTGAPAPVIPTIGKATAVSPNGVFVGSLNDPPDTAFRFSGTSIFDLTNILGIVGTTITSAVGINAKGQIAAIADRGAGDEAVLLTP
jgi:probable HAF family extracellular repeat protein